MTIHHNIASKYIQTQRRCDEHRFNFHWSTEKPSWCMYRQIHDADWSRDLKAQRRSSFFKLAVQFAVLCQNVIRPDVQVVTSPLIYRTIQSVDGLQNNRTKWNYVLLDFGSGLHVPNSIIFPACVLVRIWRMLTPQGRLDLFIVSSLVTIWC